MNKVFKLIVIDIIILKKLKVINKFNKYNKLLISFDRVYVNLMLKLLIIFKKVI